MRWKRVDSLLSVCGQVKSVREFRLHGASQAESGGVICGGVSSS